MTGTTTGGETRHRWIAVRRVRLEQEPLRDVVFAECRGSKLLAHVFSDFIAAGADRGSRGRDQIVRATAVLMRERLDGNRRDSGGEPAPAGMRRRNRTGANVRNQQRDAVGGLNRKRYPWIVGNNDVGVGTGSRIGDDRVSAVHLMSARQMRGVNASGRGDVEPGLRRISVTRGSERPGTGCEEMRSERFERAAHEGRSGLALHPDERISRLRKHG